VAQSGEKITALLVQRKVDEFKASGGVVPNVVIELPDVVIPNNVHVGKNSGDNEWYTTALHIELAPAAQWVDSTVRSDGIDPTSIRSARAQVMIAKQSLLVCRTDYIPTGPDAMQGHRTARHRRIVHR
jgi:hypothetical protein